MLLQAGNTENFRTNGRLQLAHLWIQKTLEAAAAVRAPGCEVAQRHGKGQSCCLPVHAKSEQAACHGDHADGAATEKSIQCFRRATHSVPGAIGPITRTDIASEAVMLHHNGASRRTGRRKGRMGAVCHGTSPFAARRKHTPHAKPFDAKSMLGLPKQHVCQRRCRQYLPRPGPGSPCTGLTTPQLTGQPCTSCARIASITPL